ncbi:hypothetical protein N0V93_003569 [Gnomoniopsis smithogilvyi]|uniref:DNL-type domain-containing protein n=1 Tax=Gnomoniopsis smithogilvyi TaxID=1191159 RepID=A0A9W8YXC6_9PEZI|nr:hypothetical protein N0V93_003569 [Gnomoniopsis smithogilvyi]
MASKSISSGLRTLASCGRTSSLQTRSLTARITAGTHITTPRALCASRWAPVQTSSFRYAYSTPSTTDKPQQPNTPKQPSYELTFTCVPCGSRSAHTISKQGYHHGSILITCPSCRNRHVISDHLQIFGNKKITVEELMKERGQLVKRGTLGEDGDIEFWEDGTTTVRNERQGAGEGQDPKVSTRKATAGTENAEGDVAGSSFGKA